MADAQGSIKILIAEGHSLFREAMRSVLQNEPGFDVVAEARDGIQAVAEAERTLPEVALIDANLPNRDGFKTARMIKEGVPSCRVLLLTPEESQRSLLDAVQASCDGYLSKESPLARLIEATRALHAGDTLIPPRMLGELLDRLLERRDQQNAAYRQLSQLTRREKEVLGLLAKGADNDHIAQRLVISPQTARTHIQNVLGKLGVHSRLEAAALVLQNNMFDELAPQRA